jgi:hypothetical protein
MPGGRQRRRLRQRRLDGRAPGRGLEPDARRLGERHRRITVGRQRIVGERVVVTAVVRGRRHQRAQAEPSRQIRGETQAGVLAHDVPGNVLQPPVGQWERRLPLGDRVTELVKDELRERIVGVERVVGADRDRPSSVAARVSVARTGDRETDPRRGRAPDLRDGRRGQRARRETCRWT